MITCQHARQLFDRYLDGELSPSLQAELHAHQLSCSTCQSELAMLEACGDVVALDRCEPRLSASFTDRVLLARRGQLARRPRRWGRTALLVGSPMAAAASILLAVMLIMPSESQINKTVVLGSQTNKTVVLGAGEGGVVAAPESVREAMTELTGAQERSEEAQRELAETPQMPAGFMEELLARVVERAQDAVDGARSGIGELELLLHQGISGANERLVAQLRSDQGSKTADHTPTERLGIDVEPLDPPYLNPEPACETPPELPLLDPL